MRDMYTTPPAQQTAFYSSFIYWNNFKSFSIKTVDNWLQNTLGCKVNLSIKIAGIYRRHYSDIIPIDPYNDLPSSWKTLRKYFNYLEQLGMLEFSGDDYHNPGNIWFKVICKSPRD